MESNGGSFNGPEATPSSVSTRTAPPNDVTTASTSVDPLDQYVVPGIPASSGRTFGVDLAEQLLRDGTEVPLVLQKCAEAIETFGRFLPFFRVIDDNAVTDAIGIENMGIYRLSGTTSRIQALKHSLDKGWAALP